MTLNSEVTHASHADVQSMGNAMPGAAELIILSEWTKVNAERCQEIVTEKNAEQFMTHAQILRKHFDIETRSNSKDTFKL